MNKFLIALSCFAFIATAHAQTPSAAPASGCEAKAVSKSGKPLAGAAKASFMKKCEKETQGASGMADAKANCESKAMSKDGKALHGAAKASSMKKCMAEAK